MKTLWRRFGPLQSPLSRCQRSFANNAVLVANSERPSDPSSKSPNASPTNQGPKNEEKIEAKKTIVELDEELRLKLEGVSGEGGEAGLELEDGKPAAMKRGVKNNMFRLI